MQKFVITEGENMTEKTLNNNQVVVAGEIASEFVFSHEIFGEGFYMVDLIVSRLSDAYDTIPLMVSDRLFDVNESHKADDHTLRGAYHYAVDHFMPPDGTYPGRVNVPHSPVLYLDPV